MLIPLIVRCSVECKQRGWWYFENEAAYLHLKVKCSWIRLSVSACFNLRILGLIRERFFFVYVRKCCTWPLRMLALVYAEAITHTLTHG